MTVLFPLCFGKAPCITSHDVTRGYRQLNIAQNSSKTGPWKGGLLLGVRTTTKKHSLPCGNWIPRIRKPDKKTQNELYTKIHKELFWWRTTAPIPSSSLQDERHALLECPLTVNIRQKFNITDREDILDIFRRDGPELCDIIQQTLCKYRYVCVCMYVCIHTCMYVCMCVCVRVHACVRVYVCM